MTARTYDNDSVSWSNAQVPLSSDGGTFAFTICTTAERLQTMLSVLYEGGATLGYGYIGDHNVDVIAALSQQPPPCSGLVPEDTLKQLADAAADYAGGGGAGCEDCEDCMSPLQIIRIQGRPLLAEICCGQDTNFFDLAQRSVDVATDGSLSIAASGDDSTGVESYSVSSAYHDCYASKCVEYLLGRAWDFTNVLEDLLAQGVDVLVGGIDEWLDTGGIISQILTGTGGDILTMTRGYSTTDLAQAFADVSFIEQMQDAWTYDGPVTRTQLKEWVQQAPQYIAVNDQTEMEARLSGIRMREILAYWARWSRVAGYNEDLATFAAECESGATLGDINTLVNGYSTSSVIYNGYEYPIYEYQGDLPTMDATTTLWMMPDELFTDFYSLAYQCTAAVNSMNLQIYTGTTRWSLNTVAGTEYYEIADVDHTDGTIEAVLQLYTGDVYTRRAYSASDYDPQIQGSNIQTGASTTFTRLIIVGNPVAVS